MNSTKSSELICSDTGNPLLYFSFMVISLFIYLFFTAYMTWLFTDLTIMLIAYIYCWFVWVTICPGKSRYQLHRIDYNKNAKTLSHANNLLMWLPFGGIHQCKIDRVDIRCSWPNYLSPTIVQACSTTGSSSVTMASRLIGSSREPDLNCAIPV